VNPQCHSRDLSLNSITPSPGRGRACFGKEEGVDEIKGEISR